MDLTVERIKQILGIAPPVIPVARPRVSAITDPDTGEVLGWMWKCPDAGRLEWHKRVKAYDVGDAWRPMLEGAIDHAEFHARFEAATRMID
jgi:hypothetical protein